MLKLIFQSSGIDFEKQAEIAMNAGNESMNSFLESPLKFTSEFVQFGMDPSYDLNFDNETICIEMGVSGPITGGGFIAADRELCEKITCSLLGFEEDEKLEEEDILDSMKETANILINRLVGTLADGTLSRLNMTAPEDTESLCHLKEQGKLAGQSSDTLVWSMDFCFSESEASAKVVIFLKKDDLAEAVNQTA